VDQQEKKKARSTGHRNQATCSFSTFPEHIDDHSDHHHYPEDDQWDDTHALSGDGLDRVRQGKDAYQQAQDSSCHGRTTQIGFLYIVTFHFNPSLLSLFPALNTTF
jgi:hypothetical protein